MVFVQLMLISGVAAADAGEVAARSASDFLNSIGADSAIDARGETLQKTIEWVRFVGCGWFRAGAEDRLPIEKLIELHKQTRVRFSWGLGSGGSDVAKLIETGRQLATAGALVAF